VRILLYIYDAEIIRVIIIQLAYVMHQGYGRTDDLRWQ